VKLDAKSLVAFPLGLGLDDLEAADLAGTSNMGAAISLLVETHDVDDSDLGDRVWNQIDFGADEGVVGECFGAGEEGDLDWSVGSDLGVDEIRHTCGEAFRERIELEIHTSRQRFHVAAGNWGSPLIPDHTTQDVQHCVGAHEFVTAIPVDGAGDRGADWGWGVIECVEHYWPLAGYGCDASVPAVPGEYAGVVGLATTGGIEAGCIEANGIIVDLDDGGGEGSLLGVAKIDAVGLIHD